MQTGQMAELQRQIAAAAENYTDPADRGVTVIKDNRALKLAESFDCRPQIVYETALKQGIWPLQRSTRTPASRRSTVSSTCFLPSSSPRCAHSSPWFWRGY